jgi:serine/threonine protein kinase
MKTDSPLEAAEGETPRLCPTCGTPYACRGDRASCPVCLLRRALDPGLLGQRGPAGEWLSPSEDGRFDHYELVRHDDDTFRELGRGSMGVTYRAVDTVLGYPVAIKVIDAQVAARPEARERFLREARASARLRHSNVASVLYYGVRETDGQCFYAMELVEGETLEARVRRVGPLPASFALEVVAQVSRAMAAAEAQGLVHRDLKPANLMLADGPELNVKVIDFGLAKAVAIAGREPESDITHGGFVGTPAFASPERFTGASADVRSDLYSLGITLWHMLTGQMPFKGSLAEVMYQHLHASLPLERLEGVPQPVVALLEVLLEKDPARRFQSPIELLKAMRTVTGAIEVGDGLTRQILRANSIADLPAATRKPPEKVRPETILVEKISVARLPITGSEVFGREEDIAFLDDAWENRQVNVATIVAWGGVGKSTLVNHWLRRMATKHYRSAELVFGWSFYRQGTSGDTSSADEFLNAALAWFGDPDQRMGSAWEKGERLAKLVAHRRSLLILDGLEPLQNPPGSQEGRLREPSLQALLRELAAFNQGLCVITTRIPVLDIADHERTSAKRLKLEHLNSEAGAALLRSLGVKGREAELERVSDECNGHCLALTLLGSYLSDAFAGDIRRSKDVSNRLAQDVRQGVQARKVMESYEDWFGEGPELAVLRLLGLFDRPVDEKALRALLKPPAIPRLTESLKDLDSTEWRTVLARLRRARLLAPVDLGNRGYLDTHPLVREYFGEQFRNRMPDAWKESNMRL